MHYVILAIVVAIGVLLAARWLANADPGRVAAILPRIWHWGLAALGLLLIFRGAFLIGVPLMAFAVMRMLGLGRPTPGGRWGRTRPTPGQTSNVRSQMLEMRLNHDTGEIDGLVRHGDFEGRMLSQLSIEELLALYDSCLDQTDQSAALLEAYLDSAHPGWHDQRADGDAREAPRHDGGGAMSHDEALEVLGLDEGANAEDVRQAHRRLMKQFHPDLGGSDYLAAQINRAKELLLQTLET